VIHSGIYYQPGSLKARLCTRGAALLRTFCDAHGIAHPETGKLIVAVREHELTRLDDLKRRGDANGLRGLELIEGTGIARIEPAARGLRALYSPATGIVDYSLVARALAAEITARSGVILTEHRVTGLRRLRAGWTVATTQSNITTRQVVTCAGWAAGPDATPPPPELRQVIERAIAYKAAVVGPTRPFHSSACTSPGGWTARSGLDRMPSWHWRRRGIAGRASVVASWRACCAGRASTGWPGATGGWVFRSSASP